MVLTRDALIARLTRAGELSPNGQRVVWDLLNIFRFDDQGRLVEEWVRTDYRSFLRQLGARRDGSPHGPVRRAHFVAVTPC